MIRLANVINILTTTRNSTIIGGANAPLISFSAYLIGNNKYNFAHNVMCY